MRRLFVLAALLFALPIHAVTIDWVTVGDPGNACDVQLSGCYGAVDYTYLISKYEVTNAQYAEFLNAVAATDTNALYSTNMGSGFGGITRSGSPGSYTYNTIAGRANMPVVWVSFYDSLRFANWLHNGQLAGAQDASTTEDGAYTMIAESYPGGPLIARNPGAMSFLPSEDEWYKAAYFDGTSYFDYPAGTDTQIVCAAPGPTANTANCNLVHQDLTNVGSYTGSASPYGTFDQGGNVFEFNEAIVLGTFRGQRGGDYSQLPTVLAASQRFGTTATAESLLFGFRVASIPEAPDEDEDLIQDSLDNCVQVPNPSQVDTDADNYGNACDCDFNQSLTCSIQDFNIFLPDFVATVDSGVGTDMDGNGTVGISDFNLFLPGFVAGEPGPSGVAECIAEGDSRPVVPGALPCCLGLVPIPCDEPAGPFCEMCTGASICADCGNGICGLGENVCNCPEDCPL